MTRVGITVLDTNDIFPHMEFITTAGEKVTLPDRLKEKWSVLLFYRGHF